MNASGKSNGSVISEKLLSAASAKPMAGFFQKHTTSIRDFTVDEIRVQPTSRPTAQPIAIGQAEAAALVKFRLYPGLHYR